MWQCTRVGAAGPHWLGPALLQTMAIGDAFSDDQLTPYEWAHFAFLCKLPFRLVSHELGALAQKVLGVIDEVAQDSAKDLMSEAVSRRFKDVVSGTCTRQVERAKQIARFRRSDFE